MLAKPSPSIGKGTLKKLMMNKKHCSEKSFAHIKFDEQVPERQTLLKVTVYSNRTFCDDANVLNLHRSMGSH